MEFHKILTKKYELEPDSGGAGSTGADWASAGSWRCWRTAYCTPAWETATRSGPGGWTEESPAGRAPFTGCPRATHRHPYGTQDHKLSPGKGDVIRVVTPGAGGYGPAGARPAEWVLSDVMEGKVSVEMAREQYAVGSGPGAGRDVFD